MKVEALVLIKSLISIAKTYILELYIDKDLATQCKDWSEFRCPGPHIKVMCDNLGTWRPRWEITRAGVDTRDPKSKMSS